MASKIRIKRKGIYGKGFLSEPRSEQEASIRREERREGSAKVDEQMSALNSFNHGKGDANEDLRYAERLKDGDARHKGHYGLGGGRITRVHVEGYEKEDGTRVHGYYRDVTRHDRAVDRRNGRKDRRK